MPFRLTLSPASAYVGAFVSMNALQANSHRKSGIIVTRFRVDDWYRLPSATVEVRRYGAFVRTGRVDAAAPDSQMLWLSPEGVDSRVLLDKQDGRSLDPATPAATGKGLWRNPPGRASGVELRVRACQPWGGTGGSIATTNPKFGCRFRPNSVNPFRFRPEGLWAPFSIPL